MNKILLINNAEPGITDFTEPIVSIIKNSNFTSETMEYRESNEIDFSETAGIILTGSPQGNDIVEHHLPYFRWIKKSKIPVLGICAGHHIAGFLYGAKILRNEEPESGNFYVKKIQDDSIFKRMPVHFKVRQMHNDSITLPDDFILLATSETCKNQLMKHKEKEIYTCQFHPEYYNHDLILNFLKICNKKTAG